MRPSNQITSTFADRFTHGAVPITFTIADGTELRTKQTMADTEVLEKVLKC